MKMDACVVYAQTGNWRFVQGRKQRIEGASLTEFAGMVAGILIAVVMVIFTIHEATIGSRLITEGIDTQASVVSNRAQQSRSRGRTHTQYYITYVYVVNGRSYEEEAWVSSLRYNALPVGSQLTVRYLPDDPRTVQLSEYLSSSTPYGLFLLGAIAFGAFALGPLNKEWQSHRFSRWGQLLNGRLDAVNGRDAVRWGSKSMMTRPNYDVSFEYSFRSPSGREIGGRRVVRRNDLRQQKFPEVGSPVKVLYINDQSYCML